MGFSYQDSHSLAILTLRQFRSPPAAPVPVLSQWSITAIGSPLQGCIAMSTTEAELVALAQCAIEMIYIISLLNFIGYVCKGDVMVETDNKWIGHLWSTWN